jgi:hypothetical protein
VIAAGLPEVVRADVAVQDAYLGAWERSRAGSLGR